ncbi:bifunctional diguanylate cyclase/phosphodiesterase [Christensenella minuta]|uniref:putative bifunctional diguanylate cyclase/phosphodiesterase n=1 Tax=Christensenella minuta TaxID=626937 RepID=UPI002A7F6762|nr:bifunctional diguanylate cyclase/phosphodiesterase [Christensenella minuta]MDY3751044.1 bifunctional diguanylate cyclase/phosphodiesterase [Christensenella minuta]
MKKFAKFWILVLCIMLVVISLSAVKLVSDIGNYGRLINYVGIVRGASQREVKLETNHMPSDELIEYIDGILAELETGKGRYGLVIPQDTAYRKYLSALSGQWNIVKDEIGNVRNGGNTAALIDESEELFQIANDTVFAIEDYSGRQTADLSGLILVLTIACIAACTVVVVVYVKKMLALKRKNETLENLAFRDELTGAYIMEKFKQEAAGIMERNPGEKFAVVYIDFENFKYVNDVFGYEYGDDILRIYARLAMDDLGGNEIFGRNTADQFAALYRYKEKGDLVYRQERIAHALTEQTTALKNKYMITLVYGICCVEDVGDMRDMATLLDRANFAQKTVKNSSGGRHYAFYNESIREKMIKEVTIKSRMQDALQKNEFLVYLQPKVGLKSGRVERAEALVRWDMPGRGVLPPNAFIPIFEQHQMIGALDQYVFEKICIWLHDRIAAGLKVLPISVNVSRIQFYNSDFVSTYAKIKDRYKIPDGLMEIEFTESVAFENQDYMIQNVEHMRRHGFLCSLDDFGTGYSSLGILKDLSIDVLKLDAVFFRAKSEKSRTYTVLKGIISIARALQIKTVAEGVEYKEQVDFLRKEGCDCVQGFYFYRPMPIAEFEALIAGQGSPPQ